MAGGDDDDVVPVSPRADEQPAAKKMRAAERIHYAQAEASLPLDIIVEEIAVRSDAATLVRCAATCRDARRRIAVDPNLHAKLRLRNTERFVLPLLRGHITEICTRDHLIFQTSDVFMVDTTTEEDATGLIKDALAEADERLRNFVLLDSRRGLVLLRATTRMMAQQRLFVCNLATRRCHALPPDPAFPSTGEYGLQYVLLVGGSDGEGAEAEATVGRPFQVLKAQLVLLEKYYCRRLQLHTFSSKHGTWSPLTEILIPELGIRNWLSRPLVVGDVVHWLCLTDSGSYMLMLNVGMAQVNVTSLPSSFPRDRKNHPDDERHQYLLVTATAGGNPVVLIADTDKISAWEQSKDTKIWKPRPQVVIENETIMGFKDGRLNKVVEWDKRMSIKGKKHVPQLLWFGERSGVVFLRVHSYNLLSLDLQSKKIVRCLSNRWMHCAPMYCCPYEVDLSSWVPTFSSVVTL